MQATTGLQSHQCEAGRQQRKVVSKLATPYQRYGKQVHSSLDIEAAIAANASGTVKVGYLIRGTWLTERDINVR